MMVQKAQESSVPVTHDDRFGAGTFWLVSGGILGVVTTLLNAMADGVFYIVIQRFVGREACIEGWNPTEIYLMFAFAIVSTLIFARWLWVVRREVGTKSADDDPEWSAFQRRCFTIGIYGSFFLAAPVKWLYILAMANCYGA